jgi:protein-serine/threonine kinase
VPGGQPRAALPERAQLSLDLQAPAQIPLTRRAEKLQGASTLKRLKRWFFALGSEPDMRPVTVAEQVHRNPIIMAAVDTEASAALSNQLRETVQRIVKTEPGARLACVSVMRTARIGMDDLVDKSGQSRHVKQLVQIKHWAHPIAKALFFDEGRLTFHVLEAPDPAAAIVEFARRNQVDHIVMGARGQSALRRYLGSTSSQVVAESDCTVTVVRAPQQVGEAQE